jgi:hypothetical protein
MSLLGTLAVKLTASTAKFQKDMDAATQKVRTSTDTIRSLTKASGIAFAGLSGAIGLATKALGEQRKAERRLESVANIYGTDTEVIKRYASELQKVTTFSDEATIAGAAMLQSFALTEDQLLTLIPRMQNLSAFVGNDLNAAAMLMGKAVTTSSSALSEAGIILSPVQKKLFETANQMERVALVAEVVDANVGNMAELMAKTTVGAFTQLQNSAGDLLEEFGKLVEVPLAAIFRTVRDAVDSVVGVFQLLPAGMRDVIGIGILVVTAISGIATAVGGVALVLPALITGLTAAASAMAPIAAAAAVLVIKLALLVTAIALVRKAWIDDLGGMRTVIMDFVNDTVSWWNKGVQILSDDWHGFVSFVTSAWQTTWTNVIGISGKALSAMAKQYNTFVTSIIAAIKLVFPLLDDSIADSLGQFKISVDEIETTFDDLAANAPKPFKAIKQSGIDAAEAMTAAWEDSQGDIDVFWESLQGAAGETANFVVDAFSELGSDLADIFGITGDEFGDLMAKIREKADLGVAGVGKGTGGAGEDLPKDGPEVTAAMSDYDMAMEQLGNLGTQALDITKQLGDFGSTISTAMQAWQAGGPYAAAIAVVGSLATKTQSFSVVVETLNGIISQAAKAVEPLVKALIPVVKTIAAALTPIIQTLGELISALVTGGLGPLLKAVGNLIAALMPIVNVILTVLKPVFDVFALAMRGLAIVIGVVALIIGAIVNVIIDVVAGIVDIIAGIADIFGAGGELREFSESLKDGKVNTDAIAKGIEEAATGSYELADATNEAAFELDDTIPGVTDNLDSLGDSAKETTKTFREASAALTNIPQGFKIAAARFAAIAVGSASGDIGGLEAGAGAIRTNVIEQMYVVTDDPEELVRRLNELSDWQNFSSSGTPINTPPNESKR